MINYKDLGLVNTREMFKKAIHGGYAIPAFNFNNMEQMQAIIQAAVETKSPVILQVSSGARKYANQTILRYMAEGAVAYAKELGCPNPQIVLHLDHGDTFELCKSCIDMGFSSVMIDGSHLPYDENVALTKQVVEYAHQHDVTVEGELGVLAGVETGSDALRTQPLNLSVECRILVHVFVERSIRNRLNVGLLIRRFDGQRGFRMHPGLS